MSGLWQANWPSTPFIHGQAAFALTLEGREHSLLLTVREESNATTPVRDASRGATMARQGLRILNMVSQAWGVAGEDGTAASVWASFQLRSREVS
jgi:hypothetical protein